MIPIFLSITFISITFRKQITFADIQECFKRGKPSHGEIYNRLERSFFCHVGTSFAISCGDANCGETRVIWRTKVKSKDIKRSAIPERNRDRSVLCERPVSLNMAFFFACERAQDNRQIGRIGGLLYP